MRRTATTFLISALFWLTLASAPYLIPQQPAEAQVPPPSLPANTVWGRLGIGPGPGQAIPFGVFITNVLSTSASDLRALLGGWFNVRLAITTTYPVVTADCGKTLALGGTAFYTVTFAAASGYASTCVFEIVNEDTGRGKRISINGLTSFILWPLQTVTVFNDNNNWRTNGQQRWRLPSAISIYVDSTLGNDNNDGLAAGSTGALSTIAKSWDMIVDSLDFEQQVVTVKITPTSPGSPTTYTTGLNTLGNPINACFNCIIYTSSTGTASDIIIDPNSANSSAIDIASGNPDKQVVVTIKNITVQNSNASGDCVRSSGSVLVDTVTVGKCGNAAFYVKHQGYMNWTGPVTFKGGAANVGDVGYMVAAQTRGLAIIEFQTVTISAGMACTVACIFADDGSIWASSMTFTGKSNVTSSQRYSIIHNGVVITGASAANGPAYFPGDIAGQTLSGGMYDSPGIPTVSTCGTGTPTVTVGSTDFAGEVTLGTGTPVACTITLKQFYLNAPICPATWESVVAGTAALTTASGGVATIVLTQAATSSNKVAWMCRTNGG